MSENADQIVYWNETVGAQWVARQEHLDRLMAPLTEALLEGAAPQPSEHVLDVGCGCGDLALRLAARVGSEGHVTAVDISKPMLAHAAAREKALTTAACGKIQWLEADAMTFRFAADHDLVISRFGVMFFDDRPRAFANLRAALKRGGRFAFLAWRGRRGVAWMNEPLVWVAPIFAEPELSDGEIGPFGLADAEATCALLTAAGFAEVSAEPVARRLIIGRNADEAFEMLSSTGPTARLLRDAASAQVAAAYDLLRAEIERRAGDGPLEMEGACWLYRGRA